MVNHKKVFESESIPQWRHQYIEYGELTDLLSKAVKKVHALFEAHATILKTNNLPDSGARRRSEEQHSDHSTHPVIVLDEVFAHKKFEKHLHIELSKATGFYNSKLLEIKFEIIHLLIVAIKLGLVDEFELASEEVGNFDPGSTLGILSREMKGIDVVLAKKTPQQHSPNLNEMKSLLNPNSSNFEQKDDDDHDDNKKSEHSNSNRCTSPSSSKILFVAGSKHDKIGHNDLRKKLIEDWLISKSPTISPSKFQGFISSESFDSHEYDQNIKTRPIYVALWNKLNEQSPEKKLQLIADFKKDMLEFYRQLLLVQEFGEQNGKSLQKIMKKHRKELGGHIHQSVELKAVLHDCAFFNEHSDHHTGPQLLVRHLISLTQSLYITAFSNEMPGEAKEKKKAAMHELAIEADDHEWMELFLSWKFGLTVGTSLILICVLFYATTFPTNQCKECEDVLVGLYRLTGMAAVFAWMWALVSTIVISVRIDYSMVLQYDPRLLGRASSSFFDSLCLYSFIWLIALCTTMLYLKSAPHWYTLLPLPIYPVLLFFVGIGVVALHERSTGGWFVTAVRNIISAPFYIVTFRDIFLADQFTSLVIILRDFLFMGCFLAQGGVSNEMIRTDGASCIAKTDALKPLFASLPSLWRFFQCIRRYYDSCLPFYTSNDWKWITKGEKVHLYNALKYGNAFPIITLSTLSSQTSNKDLKYSLDAGWWCFAVTDVVYKCYWDFIHDWGLGSMENHFLRPRLKAMKGNKEYLRPVKANHLYQIKRYYIAMALNFCMRSTSPLLVSSSFLGTSTGSTSIAVLEVVRRGIWNCFRLENRHLTHCNQQRARLFSRLEHFDRTLGNFHFALRRTDMFSDSSDEDNDDNNGKIKFQKDGKDEEMALPHGIMHHHPSFLTDEWLDMMLERAKNKRNNDITVKLRKGKSTFNFEKLIADHDESIPKGGVLIEQKKNNKPNMSTHLPPISSSYLSSFDHSNAPSSFEHNQNNFSSPSTSIFSSSVPIHPDSEFTKKENNKLTKQ